MAGEVVNGSAAGAVNSSAAGAVISSAALAVNGSAALAVNSSAAGAVNSSAAGAVNSSAAGAVNGSAAGAVNSSAAGAVNSSAAGAVMGLTAAAEMGMTMATRLDEMRKLTTGPTLSDQAYRALREEITTGQLKPGQRLTERALAGHLGVSPTPVREALQRLEQERLIERDAVRSIRVAEPSLARLYELTQIEVALRGVAARLAAERATDTEVRRMMEACDRAEALAGMTDWTKPRVREILKVTRGFHKLVDEAAHTQTLVDMISTATAFDWAFRVKWSVDSHPDQASLHRSLAQHRSVAAAIEARDPDAAEEAMRRHSGARARVYLAIVSASAGPASTQS